MLEGVPARATKAMAVEKEEKMTTATVDIHVVEGKDLVAMDRNGFSDPYVVVECGNAKATKRTKARE